MGCLLYSNKSSASFFRCHTLSRILVMKRAHESCSSGPVAVVDPVLRTIATHYIQLCETEIPREVVAMIIHKLLDTHCYRRVTLLSFSNLYETDVRWISLAIGYSAIVERIKELTPLDAADDTDFVDVQYLKYVVKSPVRADDDVVCISICPLSQEEHLTRCLAESTTYDTICVSYTLRKRARLSARK